MKGFKIFLVIGLFFLMCGIGNAAVIGFPTFNQTAQSVFELGRTPVNFITNLSSAGATARTQLATNTTSSCTLQAFSGNAGAIYIGGATVTNSSGVNEGIKLSAGDAFGPISVIDSNLIYVATDNANDDVKAFCN